MRLPFAGEDYFSKETNTSFEKIQTSFLEAMRPQIATSKVSARLGDGTVAQVDSFEIKRVECFFDRLADLLEGWTSTGISSSATDDLHRLYIQFAQEIDRYYVIGYFGVQYHSLPYYQVDKRVIEIQNELTILAQRAAGAFTNMTGKVDKLLQEELVKMGYGDMEFQELLTKLIDDEELSSVLDRKAASVESNYPEFGEMQSRKSALFSELSGLVTHLCQTSAVTIDHNRMMQGEEGVVTYFDIEVVKGKKTKSREAYINTQRVTHDAAKNICQKLYGVADALQKMAGSR